jgi:uncharacterized protein (TIGR02453 family)
MLFTGFTPATIDFMWNIRHNNNKAWFEAHKTDFQRDLQTPLKQLIQDVYERITPYYSEYALVTKVGRIYKDARRVRDGMPYRDSLWCSIERPGTNDEVGDGILTFWFELGPESWTYGLGYYAPKAAVMEKVRKKIDENPKEFERLVDLLDSQKEFILEGPGYARPKTAPTPKTQDWYNKKSFSLIHHGQTVEELFDAKLVDRIADSWESLKPFYDYFSTI